MFRIHACSIRTENNVFSVLSLSLLRLHFFIRVKNGRDFDWRTKFVTILPHVNRAYTERRKRVTSRSTIYRARRYAEIHENCHFVLLNKIQIDATRRVRYLNPIRNVRFRKCFNHRRNTTYYLYTLISMQAKFIFEKCSTLGVF